MRSLCCFCIIVTSLKNWQYFKSYKQYDYQNWDMDCMFIIANVYAVFVL